MQVKKKLGAGTASYSSLYNEVLENNLLGAWY